MRTFWTAALVATVAGFSVGQALAQSDANADERLNELETRMRSMREEIETLKKQAEEERAWPVDAAADRSAPKGKLADGLVFEDEDGNWRLRFTGRALMDYRAFSPDDLAADTFSVRQARLGVQLGFSKHYSIYVEGEYSGSSAILSNAYMDFAWWPAAKFRFGQFKPMFGLEHTDRVPYFDFTERGFTGSLTQNFLFDRGIMVFGMPEKGIYYGLSLTNGSGQNQDERQANAAEVESDGKDLTGRVAVNFAELFPVPGKILQAGLSYKVGEQANSQSNPYSAASLTTEGRGMTFFTPAAFNSATGDTSAIDRQIVAGEALVARGPVKFQSEYMQASYRGTNATAVPLEFKRTLSAWYASVTWLITGESYADAYKDGMIARIRPRQDYSPGAGWGAWELGFRYSAFDGTDFSDANAPDTGRLGATAPVQQSTNKADAYTLGLKWMPNAYARFLLDYINTDFSTPVSSAGRATSREQAVNFRAQVDFF
jgi:phosphate-selective porin OprO/OprP